MSAASREEFMDREREMYRSPEWRDWVAVTTTPVQVKPKEVKKSEYDSKEER